MPDRRPVPDTPGPGQESVWRFPRPAIAEPTTAHLRIFFDGRVLAETRRAVRTLETSHPPSYYFPPDDVDMALLAAAGGGSFCEWKGTAHYYDVAGPATRAPRAAWAYARPTAPFAILRDHIAFYPAAMEACFVDGEPVTPQPGGFYGGWITGAFAGPFKGGPGTQGVVTPPLLSVSGLAKSVPGGRMLFSGLDLAVPAGELVAIVGESGVGKSTLLNILAGLDGADAGTLAIEGTDLTGLNEAALTRLRRTRIGFVFQAFHVLPYLTLRQNVALPLALVSADRRAVAARAQAMLERVGLGERWDGYARDLSGGELQRVAIARALVHRPAMILADEPTGNLDPDTAARVLALFAEAVREGGVAGIIVTHSRSAAAIADRTLTLTAHGLVEGEARDGG